MTGAKGGKTSADESQFWFHFLLVENFLLSSIAVMQNQLLFYNQVKTVLMPGTIKAILHGETLRTSNITFMYIGSEKS